MTEGPFGGPRPFADDTRTIVIQIGIDGEEPPQEVMHSVESVLEDKLIDYTYMDFTTSETSITTWHAEDDARRKLGGNTLTVFQFSIETGRKEVSIEQAEAFREAGEDALDSVGFIVSGSFVTVK